MRYTRLDMVILITIYIIIGVLSRTVFHIGSNIEFVTGLSLSAGYFLNNRYSIIVPFFIMAISDILIGNSIIFLFTWSAFLSAPFIGIVMNHIMRKFTPLRLSILMQLCIASEVGGIGFVLFFYLWTNFGVVFTSTMYIHDLSGVIQSYMNGLPFLWNQLIGNIIIVPTIFIITYYTFHTFLYKHKTVNIITAL